jgi:hypothetical protein
MMCRQSKFYGAICDKNDVSNKEKLSGTEYSDIGICYLYRGMCYPASFFRAGGRDKYFPVFSVPFADRVGRNGRGYQREY